MIYKQIIEDLNNSPFSNIIKNGTSARDISSTIQSTFSCFFDNKANLQRFSNDFLIQDLINYTKNHYTEIDNNILSVLNVLKSSKLSNSDETFKLMAQLQADLVDISVKMWSYTILQPDFSKIDKYEYISECFTMIQNISETSMKPFLNYLHGFSKLSQGKPCNIDEIKKMPFGQVYNALLAFNDINTLILYFNNQVSLSQWRNIACHKSYKISSDSIICTYGKNNDKTYVVSTKETLMGITKKINTIFQSLNFAFKFFLYDNIQDIEPHYKVLSIDEDRDESWHLLFTTELYMNGFKVNAIEKDGGITIVDIQDMTQADTNKRAIQSSIAIYKVWYYSKAALIRVLYRDYDGNKVFSAQSTDKVCEEIGNGKKEIYFLIENMIIEKF